MVIQLLMQKSLLLKVWMLFTRRHPEKRLVFSQTTMYTIHFTILLLSHVPTATFPY